MAVNSKHPKYAEFEGRWKVVHDLCDGANAVKKAGVLYLPEIRVSKDQKENDLRNQAYRDRAVLYEITKDTKQELIGIAFSEDPNFDPDGMEFLKYNADGTGKSYYHLMQSALGGLLDAGRGGLFVDYPQTDGATSVAEVERLGILPTVVHYKTLSIINWGVRKVGAHFKTALVVLAEKDSIVDPSDEFRLKEIQLYRVLRLDQNGEYCVQIYSDRTGTLQADSEPYYPTDANGAKWNEIPFIPLGSVANDWEIDNIPLESLALMNIAHYHNSAEYENSVFLCGQIQPVMTGLDTDWRDWLQENGVMLGSTTPLMLPTGATFTFAQAEEQMIAKEAMEAKEKHMKALGAKLLEENQVVKTATESNNESMAKYSVLSLCVANLNEASEIVLRWCAKYFGSGDKAKFTIKQDFAKGKLSLDALKFYNELVQQGKLSRETFHTIRTTGKVPEIDYEEEEQRIEAETASALPGMNYERPNSTESNT